MLLFKKKRRHEQTVASIKESIHDNFEKAKIPIKENRQSLQRNQITIEIKKAVGSPHV